MTESRQQRLMLFARSAFLVGVSVFAWVWLKDRWDEVYEAALDIRAWQAVCSIVFVLAGLVAMRAAWGRLLSDIGHDVPWRSGSGIFFIGQLGKYVPGSVWHLVAQGGMGKKFQIPIRTSVAVGLLLIYWLSVSALLVSVIGVMVGWMEVSVPSWMVYLAAVVALVAALPRVATFLTRLLIGKSRAGTAGAPAVGHLLFWMFIVWCAFGSAAAVLHPGDVTTWNLKWWGESISSFSFAFGAGLVLPFAPAGAGVREAILVTQVSPTLGESRAVALAILLRLIHAIADFAIAGVSWLLLRIEQRSVSPHSDASSDL